MNFDRFWCSLSKVVQSNKWTSRQDNAWTDFGHVKNLEKVWIVGSCQLLTMSDISLDILWTLIKSGQTLDMDQVWTKLGHLRLIGQILDRCWTWTSLGKNLHNQYQLILDRLYVNIKALSKLFCWLIFFPDPDNFWTKVVLVDKYMDRTWTIIEHGQTFDEVWTKD